MGRSNGRSASLLLATCLLFSRPLWPRDIEEGPARYPLPVTPQASVAPAKAGRPLTSEPVIGPVRLGEQDDAVRLLLLYTDIANATDGENRLRAQAIGLEVGDAVGEDLRLLLYGHYGIEQSVDDKPTIIEQGSYRLEIINARRMATSTASDAKIVVEGSVTIRFSEDGTSGYRQLSCSALVLDTARSLLIALGSVDFTDSEGDVKKRVEGSAIAYWWKSGDIAVGEGITSMIRTNSESQQVEFFTSGRVVDMGGDQSVISFSDGVVTTNRTDAYASITAKRLALIQGGDMFVEQAWISIGRVPLVWIPFLFYPGQTFTFNPAFGTDSSRGLFFSATLELYGTYPKLKKSDESSFATLLDASSGGNRVKAGWVYAEGKVNQDGLDLWADESSSYMALLADSYQTIGTFIGLDTKNSFFSRSMTVSAFGGLAVTGAGASLSTAYAIPALRYFLQSSLALDSKVFDVKLDMPLYSDPLVLKHYANRLTSFSIAALRGSQDFPDSYANDVASMTWQLTASADIPTGTLASYVSSLKISQAGARAVWKARPSSQGPGYVLSSLVLPEINATLAGTVLSLGATKQAMASKVQSTQPVKVPTGLEGYGVAEPYRKAVAATSTVAQGQVSGSYLKLSYSVNPVLSHSIVNMESVTPTPSLFGKAQGALALEGALAPDWVQAKVQLTPSFSFDADDVDQQGSVRMVLEQKYGIPRFGLTYGLSLRLYSYQWTIAGTNPATTSSDWISWNQQEVLEHSLSFKRQWRLGTGAVTASLNGSLPPKTFSLTPGLSFAFGKISVLMNHTFADSALGTLYPGRFTSTVRYQDSKRISVSVDAVYLTSEALTGAGTLWDPLTLKASVSLGLPPEFLQVSQTLSYSAATNVFESLVTKLTFANLDVQLSAKGPAGAVRLSALDVKANVDGWERRWWKNRIVASLDMDAAFHYGFIDPGSTALRIKALFGFKIAEFLGLELAVTTANKGFSRYADIGDLLQDLLRSFDFFGTGRYRTQFNMERISLDLVHVMDDWDLHCKYEGSVVLSDKEWRWKPVFTVFLQWKAIPEIKVDRRF